MGIRIVAVVVLVLVSAGMGYLMFLIYRPSAERRTKQLNGILRRADLAVDEESWARLDRQAVRRGTWGALGGGVGGALTFPVGVVLGDQLGDAALLFAVGGTFVGLQIGSAVSVLRPAERPNNRVRLSALQPHGLQEYLRKRDLAAEILFAVSGVAAVLFGLVVIARPGESPSWSWLPVALGAAVSATAVVVLWLQRRLLSAPRAAGDDTQLVVNDVILAIGLLDLVGASFTVTLFAGEVIVLSLANSSWYLVPYFVAIVAIGRLVFYSKSQPSMAPVAHRLAAASQ